MLSIRSVTSGIGARFTYANVMSTMAFVIAFGGGTAYATHLAVMSDDIVDGQVTTPDLAADATRARNISPTALSQFERITPFAGSTTYRMQEDAVGGREVKPNSLSGADISEGSLGAVPVATRATNVDGLQRFRFNSAADPSNAKKTLVTTSSGLTIKGQCTSGGDLEVFATTSRNARLLSWSVDSDARTLDNHVALEDFTPSHVVDLVNTDDGDQSGQTSFLTEANGFTVVTWAADNNASVGFARQCSFVGSAVTH